MSGVAVALVVALLVGLARVPWSTGRSARLAGVGRRCRRAAGSLRGGAPDASLGDAVLDDAVLDGAVLDDAGGVDVVLVLDLLEVAVASGAALPRAVHAVGDAVGGDDGAALTAAARALVLGAGWSAAWSAVPGRLAPVAECLADSWSSGAAPGPRLRAAADEVNRDRRRSAREAAGRLGVRLVLPLGLCLLPSFVLLGLVPVVVSLAGGLLG
ncbi:type II secretion system F family protein [Cellulomonas sp. NPDC055163]